MLTAKLVTRSRKENTYAPNVGDFCTNSSINLFKWTEAHNALNVLTNLEEYKNTRVVELLLVTDDKSSFPWLTAGDFVLTENNEIQEVSKVVGSAVFGTENQFQFWHKDTVSVVVAKPSEMANVVITVHDDSDMPCGTEIRELNAYQAKNMLASTRPIYIDYVEVAGKYKAKLYDGKVLITEFN